MNVFRLRRVGDSRRPLSYFTSFPGSGKSRLCGKFAQFMGLLRCEDPAATETLRLEVPSADAAAAKWARRVHVVGLNVYSIQRSLCGDDKTLSELGLLVPLYLRIIFFVRADLDAPSATHDWEDLCSFCQTLLKLRFIIEAPHRQAVRDQLRGLAGSSPPYQPLIIIANEIHTVRNFFSPEAFHAADKIRSGI